MKRYVLPFIGLLAAAWAAYSLERTQPRREATNPPSPPPVSDFATTVAAVGLVEASTENISVGTPLSGVVVNVFVTPGQSVKAGEPLFELDTRHLQATLKVLSATVAAARSRLEVTQARLEDAERQLEFAEQVRDKRAISEEEFSRRRYAARVAKAEREEAKSRLAVAESELRPVVTEIERSTIHARIDAEVLQVKVRVGEFAPAATTSAPLVLLGRTRPLYVRVDVDESEGWRVRAEAKATGHVRGNADIKTPLSFVRFEPFVVPKKSLTGDSTERVDTRVLQVIYRVERDDLRIFIGQQLDVFIEAVDEDRGRLS